MLRRLWIGRGEYQEDIVLKRSTGQTPARRAQARGRKSPDGSRFYVSTGHLPPSLVTEELVMEAYRRFRSNRDGKNSQVYPALAMVPRYLFGICVVGTDGDAHSAGDADYEFAIMSVSKPFIF